MSLSALEDNLHTLGLAAEAAGCRFCYYYPGMKGDAFATAINHNAMSSLNERNAFEFGYGASLAGARAAVVFKGVGLATCIDSVHHAVIGGVGAGLVVVVLEDTVAVSSPEIIDSRLFIDYLSTVVIEPASMESAVLHTQQAFALSERLDVPVILRLTFGLLSSTLDRISTPTATMPKISQPIAYRKKFIGPWTERSKPYERKITNIHEYIRILYDPQSKIKQSSLRFGHVANAPKNSLVIEHYPIVSSLKELYRKQHPTIYEAGSNYALRTLETQSPPRINNKPAISGTLEPSAEWEYALAPIDKKKYPAIVGDEGRYTFDTTQKIDICLCMGSAINICAGMSEAMGTPCMAVTGDFAFLFSGYQSILEAYSRNISLDIVLLDDGKATSTGGQESIAAINQLDFRSYLAGYKAYDYEAMAVHDEYDLPEGNGINFYHIKRHEA